MKSLLDRVVFPFLRMLFGEVHWSPPAWLRLLFRPVEAALRPVANWRRRSPNRSWTTMLGLLILVAVGFDGWRWWQNQPKPHFLTWEMTPLAATPLEEDAKPQPLVIRFSGSGGNPRTCIGGATFNYETHAV